MKRWKRVVDNRLKEMGETDDGKREIRINKRASRKTPGGVLDTIVHEEMHRKHPKMHEKTVWKRTPKETRKMGLREKERYYSLYRQK